MSRSVNVSDLGAEKTNYLVAMARGFEEFREIVSSYDHYSPRQLLVGFTKLSEWRL